MLFWGSLALYALSLALPAYVTYEGKTTQEHPGLEALLLGPIGFFDGHFAWLANLFLWGAWVTRSNKGESPSFLLALLALAPAVLFLLGEKIAVGSAGEYSHRASSGYYLWLGSMLAAAAAAFSHRQPPDEESDAAP